MCRSEPAANCRSRLFVKRASQLYGEVANNHNRTKHWKTNNDHLNVETTALDNESYEIVNEWTLL